MRFVEVSSPFERSSDSGGTHVAGGGGSEQRAGRMDGGESDGKLQGPVKCAA